MSVSEDLLCAFELLKVRIAFSANWHSSLLPRDYALTHRWFRSR